MGAITTYIPYNFSETKCHVIKLNIPINGIGNIEEKLPAHIGCIKGIFVSCNILPPGKGWFLGGIFLTLNEGILKNFQLPLINTARQKDCSLPLELNEDVPGNSVLYGYYVLPKTPVKGTITIYLHYEERKDELRSSNSTCPPKNA